MKILRDLIERMMIMQQNFYLKKYYFRSFWIFYKSYSMAINILGVEDNEIKKRNKIFSKMMKNFLNNNQKGVRVYENKLNDYMSRDICIITKAVDKMVSDHEDSEEFQEGLWEPGVIDIPYYEFEGG